MLGEFTDLYAVLACGAVVAAAEAVTIPLLRRAAVIDVPGHRSSHTVPTPRGGGVPIAAGLLVAAGLIGGAIAVVFAFAVAAFGLLGFAEDLRGLTMGRRLTLQAAGAVLVATVLVSGLAGPTARLVLLAALCAVWITAFVNAFNFMDGVNGISGAHALIGGVVYALLGWWQHDGFMAPAGAAVAAGALAFLPWNAGQARVFLGDAGSYALGAALAVLAAYALVRGVPAEAVLGPARALSGRHGVDPVAAHPGRGALAGGAPHSHLPAVVRCRMVAPAGHADGRGGHGPAQPARGGQSGRRSRPAGGRRPGRGGGRRGVSALAGPARPPHRPVGGMVTMRILMVTHYFPPETGAPQARLSGLAAAWAAAGDDVTVLTGMPNHPTGVVPPEYRGAIRRRERRDGYRVLRTWLYASPNEGTVRKAIGHLSFMITSALLGGRASGPADVVVVSSPSFFAVGSAWLLARLKRARLVVEVRDLWPAIFTELGVVTNRRIIGLLERLELAAYAAADTVIVVSDGFRANLIGARRAVRQGTHHPQRRTPR